MKANISYGISDDMAKRPVSEEMKNISAYSIAAMLRSPEAFLAALEHAERFSNEFRACEGLSASEREARVLRIQFPHVLQSPEEGDLLAGRILFGPVGLSPEAMELGYYCANDPLRKGAADFPEYADRADALIRLWKGRTTHERVRAAVPESVRQAFPDDDRLHESGIAFPLYRMAGTTLNYEKLLTLGLDGLEAATRETPFAHVPPILRNSIQDYIGRVEDAGIRETLRAILHAPPETFRQAVQLFWLYALHSGTWNYGRLDVALVPFLARDIDRGRATEPEALDLLCSLYRLMRAYASMTNNRFIVGGKGRLEEAAADRFALLAIEAVRRVRLNQPQLTLRFYEGQNPELWERALDAIGEGCTYPLLYNDDVNIPAVAKAFSVNEEMAANYIPYGCGEYVLDHFSVGPPNGIINVLKALEVALHGGVDPL